ncbi:hypothetical protein M2140_001716 [Clostridiales Family XIII bacterium PM5-7]
MSHQTVFKRYELKYLLHRSQKEQVLQEMKPYMSLDQIGCTTIRNIYFDTENYRLIRQSIEKPIYKEKLRLRSYTQANANSPVFVELKKKYKSVVYKRRLLLPEGEAMSWLCGGARPEDQTSIANEIDYFLDYYHQLYPTAFLSYDREAYYANAGDDFRITFDDHVLFRQEDLSLTSDVWGTPLLEKDAVLMEIKCSGGIPLWMTHILSKEQLYKTSFSKYGTAYQTMISPRLMEDRIYA